MPPTRVDLATIPVAIADLPLGLQGGIATLDGTGKVPDGQLSDGLLTLDSDGTHKTASGLYIAPSNCLIGGHSFTDPGSALMKHQPAVGYGFGERLARKLGLQSGQVLNMGASGAAIRSHLDNGATKYVADKRLDPGNSVIYPQIPRLACAFLWFGANDYILGNGGFVQAGVQNNMRALISWLRASWACDYNHPSVTKTGAWTNLLYSTLDLPWGQGAGCTYSTTVGDHYDIDLTNVGGLGHICQYLDTITVAVRAVTGPNGANVQVKLDGATVGNFSTGAQNFDFNNKDERGVTVFRVPVTQANSTITLTITSVISGNGGASFAGLVMDGWHAESSIPPLVLWGESNVPAIRQGLIANQTPAFIDTVNAWSDAVIAEFNHPSVRKVHLDATLGGTVIRALGQGTTLANTPVLNLMFQGLDGLHPNDRGVRVAVAEIQREIMRALAAGLDPASLTGFATWEKPPLTSLQATLYQGDGPPLQLLDNFEIPDQDTPPAGWSALMGGWGVRSGQLALINDLWLPPTFVDAFNRANGAVGNGWNVLSGTWAISGNEAKNTGVAGGGVLPKLASPTQLDVNGNGGLSFDVGTVRENFSGIYFRRQDDSNYWALWEDVSFGGYYLAKYVAGVQTVVQNTPGQVNATGTHVHVECNNNKILYWANAALLATTTDAAMQTARGCGLIAWSTFGVGPTFENFDVRPGPADVSDTLNFNAIVRDIGVSDFTFTFVVGDSGPVDLEGVVFRYVDNLNYILFEESATFGGWNLTYVIAGTPHTIGSGYRLNATAGAVVSISCSNDTFNIVIDGTPCPANPTVISGSPKGTKIGAVVYPQIGTYAVPSPLPQKALRQVSTGGSTVIIPDQAYYRDRQTGSLYGPFVNGSYSDQQAFEPTDGIHLKEIDSTGKTSAQIDALLVHPDNAKILSDPTNHLALIRQGGKWYKTSAMTLIP